MSWHAGNAFEISEVPHSINALPYEVRTQLAQKKSGFVEGISAAPGIEGSRCSGPVSTSSNHADNEPAVTSSDNWPGGPRRFPVLALSFENFDLS